MAYTYGWVNGGVYWMKRAAKEPESKNEEKTELKFKIKIGEMHWRKSDREAYTASKN